MFLFKANLEAATSMDTMEVRVDAVTRLWRAPRAKRAPTARASLVRRRAPRVRTLPSRILRREKEKQKGSKRPRLRKVPIRLCLKRVLLLNKNQVSGILKCRSWMAAVFLL